MIEPMSSLKFPLQEIDRVIRDFETIYYKKPDYIAVDSLAKEAIKSSLLDLTRHNEVKGIDTCDQLLYANIPIKVHIPSGPDYCTVRLHGDGIPQPMILHIPFAIDLKNKFLEQLINNQPLSIEGKIRENQL